tara:strand:+ start:1460 stop:3073 length:1614 start_codon:yes stop_codon:yes gene_type:complete
MTKARDLASSGVTLTSTTTTADAALARAGGTMTGDLAMGTNLVDGVDVSARDAVLTSTTTLASAALPKSGGAMTGAITTNSTFDGVDIATRDAVLSSTTTTATNALNNANNALPKEGGAMTGPITTNSTFDGVDVGSRDSVLTSTTTTADAALPRTGGAMTGAITTNSTFDGVDIATRDAVLTATTTTANAALPKAGGAMTGNLSTTGRIGIGTASPGVGLEVSGSGNDSRLKLIDGSDQLNIGEWDGSNHRIEGDATRKLLITSYHTDGIHIGNSGASNLVIKGGNVGIGCTPTHKLEIRNDVPANSDLDSTAIKLYNASDGGSAIEFSNGVSGKSKISFGVQSTGAGTDDTYLGFSTGANTALAEKVRIDSAGHLIINDGNLVIGTAGHGINFQAYGAGTNISSNLLDDYEEGTFNPTFVNGTVGTNSTTGEYTKIGNTVYVNINLNVGSVTNLHNSYVGPLPFTPNTYTTMSVFPINGFTQLGAMICAQVATAGQVQLYLVNNSTGANYTLVGSSHLNLSSVNIRIAGSYTTNS